MARNAPCPACAHAQTSHFSLWLANSSDVLAVRFNTAHGARRVRLFSRIGEAAWSAFGHALFHILRAFGAARLGDDIEKARSRRSKLLWEEARRRSIPMRQVFLFGLPSDVFEIRMQGKRRFVQSIPFPAANEDTLGIDDKVAFKRLMRANGLLVPRSESVRSLARGKETLARFGTVCVKPQSGSNSRHTYPYVRTEEELKEALRSAKEICAFASVEEHLEGNLARATCVDGKLLGFLESFSPAITGDGTTTVAELVARLNAGRPDGVAEVVITSSHEGYMKRRGFAMTDVLPQGASLPLTFRAGCGEGGSNREHGRAIHPSFIPFIEKAAALTRLPIVGFDLIIPDPLAPADSQKWGFIEANSLPWIDLHAAPFMGEPIDLAPAVWDLWGATPSPARPA